MRLQGWRSYGRARAWRCSRMLRTAGVTALSADSSQTYVVQMLPSPVVTYAGGILVGLPATKPGEEGKKIDRRLAATSRSTPTTLTGKHDCRP